MNKKNFVRIACLVLSAVLTVGLVSTAVIILLGA